MTISITTTNDAQTLVNNILGSGITVSNLSYTGTETSSGIFIDGISSGIGIDEGIIITSGDATLVPGANTQGAAGISNDLPGDKDLNSLVPGTSTFDATILEFDFESNTGDLFFNFVFASEEYNEYVGGGFDDVFGFFLDGQNIAIIPGTNTPVSIDNINNNQNTNLFNDNETGSFDNQYDGFTEVMAVEITDLEEGTHNIKLAIADTGDSVLDSAVFIQGNTFTSIPKNPTIINPDTNPASTIVSENQIDVINLETSDDLDFEGEGLTYNITGGEDGAMLSVDSFGLLTFITPPDFEQPSDANGDNNYEVQITVTDSSDLTDVQDLTVIVTEGEENPTIIIPDTTPATVSIPEGQTNVIDIETTDDLDAESDGLTYSITGGTDGELFAIDRNTGELSFIATPNFDEPGDADVDNNYEVQVTVYDSSELTDFVDLNINISNNLAPSIISTDSVSILENTTSVIDVMSLDDNDAEGMGLTYRITGGADGELFTINPTTGIVDFIAAPDFDDPLDSNVDNDYELEVTIADSGTPELTDVQNITITVTKDNESPEAVDNSYKTLGGNVVAGNLISEDTGAGFDSDPDEDSLSVISNSEPSNGSVIVTTDGSFSYTPNPGFIGSDSFTYTITDGNEGSDSATVTITVTNNQPDAVDDLLITNEDVAISGNVLDGSNGGLDTDPDDQNLTVIGNTEPANGSVIINAIGDFTYNPNPNFNGTDSYSYTIDDGNGGNDTATVTVTVNPINDQPQTLDEFAITDEDTPVTTNVLGNDSDIDEDVLTVTEVTNGTNGTTTVNSDGNITYTPNPNFNGTDNYNYTIDDGNGGNDTATVTLTVNPTNDLPDAVDNNYSTNGAITVSGNLISDNTGEGLDHDLDFEPLIITGNSNPSNGSVVVNPYGNFTYTLNPGFIGTDSFTYTISDINNASDTATVTINVNNQPPTIITPATVTVGETKTTTVTENQTTILDINITDDLDVEGTGLTYRLTGGADQTLFNLDSSTGVLSFASTPDFENPADTNRDNNYQVQVTVTDSTGLSAFQDLTISIADDPTDNPVIQNLLTESLNTVGGTLGNDALTGTTNSDSLEGLAGNDVLDGRAGNDLLNGGLGTDTAVYQSDPEAVNADLNRGTTSGGFGGNDTLIGIENIIGSEFNDIILGDDQNNSLTGKGGNDKINAGGGNDFLVGSVGADTLTGGSGADSFIYLSPSDGIGDVITDFEVDVDQILIVGALFPEGLFGGVLPEFQFFFGSEAEDEDHRFGYDPEKNQILFDRDGDGSATLQVLATLVGAPDFGHSNIQVL